MPATRIRVPATAKRGEIIEIRTMIVHPMENGFRFESQGQLVPVNIIDRIEIRFNGAMIYRAELGTGIAPNPYLSFFTRVTESGRFTFLWHDDTGEVTEASAEIEVS